MSVYSKSIFFIIIGGSDPAHRALLSGPLPSASAAPAMRACGPRRRGQDTAPAGAVSCPRRRGPQARMAGAAEALGRGPESSAR